MSLIQEINNTNTQKENIKTVANNIDNKLVELGGEKATDLSDVANKMEGMVGQYKKIAIFDFKDNPIPWGADPSDDSLKFPKIPINVDFQPERAILTFSFTPSIPENIEYLREFREIIYCEVPHIFDGIPCKEFPNMTNRVYFEYRGAYFSGNVKLTKDYIEFIANGMSAGSHWYVMRVMVIG